MSSPATTHMSGSVEGELSEHPPSPSPPLLAQSPSLGGSPASSVGVHLASDSARSDPVSPSAAEYQHLVESTADDVVVSSVPEERFASIPDPFVLSAALRVAAHEVARCDEYRRYEREFRAHLLKWAGQVSPQKAHEAAVLLDWHHQRLAEIDSRFGDTSA